MATTASRTERIEEVLTDVIDPCSATTNRPTNIVEFGLVEDIHTEGDTAHITIVTTPMCMYLPHMKREIRRKVTDRVGGIEAVNVERTKDVVWTNDRMSETELREREEWKQEQIDKHDLEPYEYDD